MLNRAFETLRGKVEDVTYHALKSVGQKIAGLERKATEVLPGLNLHYFDNNNTAAKETLVLIHGFNVSKDHWTLFSAHLKQYRVLVPDLGGHGENCFDEDTVYDIPYQVTLLNRFLSRLNIHTFHLAGNSMGGWVTTYYTSEFPDAVKTMGLFSAAGVESPTKSHFFKSLEKGENYFYFNDRAGFDELSKLGAEAPIFSPWPIMQIQARLGIAQQTRTKKIFSDIINREHTYFTPQHMVDTRLPDIKQPTLILWGKQDRIMDLSMAEIYANGLENNEKIYLDGVGHVPMLEKPRLTANLYAAFIERHS